MTEFDLPDVDRFTAGTIGEPGARVFYLQAIAGTQVVSLQLEKGQVGALAQYLAELLHDLPTPADSEVPQDMELTSPVIPEWIVGQLGVVFDEGRDRMVVRADEIALEEDADDEVTLGMARFALTRGQVQAFVVRATLLLSTGRPTCPLCARPIDPDGHMCIKTNGHKKH
ncbi:MAG: hypothetical protein JWN67_1946 [Actinomycetia bacterium]|nr:hypothetical protein [Actinomycetes bacterium]